MDPNLLDIIIILTMLVSGLLALTQGFVKEILSLMGWIVSFVSVILLMPEAGNYLKPFFESQAMSDLITISIIFIVTMKTMMRNIGKISKIEISKSTSYNIQRIHLILH